MKVVSIGFLFTDARTLAMLPDVATLTGDAVCAIVNLTVKSADAVECPLLFLFLVLELLQGLFISVNFSLQAPFGDAAGAS